MSMTCDCCYYAQALDYKQKPQQLHSHSLHPHVLPGSTSREGTVHGSFHPESNASVTARETADGNIAETGEDKRTISEGADDRV